VAAAGERRSRAIVSTGVRVAGVVTRPAGRIAVWPAALAWRSQPAAPLRHLAAEASADLARDGHGLVVRAEASARAAATQALWRIEGQLAASEFVDRMIDRLLTSGAFDRVLTVLINHPATEELVASALDDPGLDRLITRVMESRLIDELTAQLLASEEMRLVLDYVTRSPELRAALAHQTAGLADDMADGVRSRTFVADATAERFARSLLRRRRRPEAGTAP
jgi:hypothetical protein